MLGVIGTAIAVTITFPPPSQPSLLPAASKFRAHFSSEFPRPLPSVSVTSVGGTRNIPEIAASLSSGGFSNYFARPSYQSAAVSLTSPHSATHSKDYTMLLVVVSQMSPRKVSISRLFMILRV